MDIFLKNLLHVKVKEKALTDARRFYYFLSLLQEHTSCKKQTNKQDQHSFFFFFFATCPSNMASASDWITDSKLFPDPSLNEVSTLLPIICLSPIIVVSQKDIALEVTHSNSPLSFIIL